MKRIFFIMLALVLAIGLAAIPVLAADYPSNNGVTTLGDNTMSWTGQGATGGELDELQCEGEEGDCYVAPGDDYLLWIFTYDAGEQVFTAGVTPYLVLGGTGSGTYYPCKAAGKEFHFVTPYYTPDSSLTAVVHFYTLDTGTGVYNLVISHGCSGCTGCLEITKELSIPKRAPMDLLDGTFVIHVAGPGGYSQNVSFTMENGEITSENPVTLCDLAAGKYTLSEGEMPEYWGAPDLPVDVEVSCGEPSAAVTVTNTYTGPTEDLDVVKTVNTSYTRTHSWSIDKAVDTENKYTEDGYPKIWLYVDGSGDETATWTVNVTYGGYEDSDYNISGNITITNIGDVDTMIEQPVDILGGINITDEIDWGGATFPYPLAKGETLTGTYSYDGYLEGDNEVTVFTQYNPEGYYFAKDIEWGDPTEDINATVEVTDTNPGFSDKYGQVILDAYDYTEGDVITFTYDKHFAWANYGATGCGDYTYDNTAEVIGDDEAVLDSAGATLKVNVQCYTYVTAYAKAATNSTCFIPTFDNWGWTNRILPGTYTWDLWAGAGQCDPTKGTLVGNVTVVYSATTGVVTVTYNVAFPYTLNWTSVYAGTTMWPRNKVGKIWVNTVAPGQYYNAGPFTGATKPLVYVIAHAKVGIPDPNFGP
jgi:hypothetical protein